MRLVHRAKAAKRDMNERNKRTVRTGEDVGKGEAKCLVPCSLTRLEPSSASMQQKTIAVLIAHTWLHHMKMSSHKAA